MMQKVYAIQTQIMGKQTLDEVSYCGNDLFCILQAATNCGDYIIGVCI